MIFRKTFSRLPRESSGTLNFQNPIGCLVVKYTKWTFTSGAVRRYEYYDNTIKIACSRLFPTTGRQEDIKLYYIDFSSYVDVFAMFWTNKHPVRCPRDGGCGVISIGRLPVEWAAMSTVAVSMYRTTDNGGHRKSFPGQANGVKSILSAPYNTYMHWMDGQKTRGHTTVLYEYLVDVFTRCFGRTHVRPGAGTTEAAAAYRSAISRSDERRCRRLRFPCTRQPTTVEIGRAFPSSTPTGSSSSRYWPRPDHLL